MTLKIAFYRSANWNTGDSGTVGGIPTTTVVTAALGKMFPSAVSGFIGQAPARRFQKVFITNTGTPSDGTITGAAVFLHNVKYTDQIKIAFGTSTDTGGDPTFFPEGLATGDFTSPLGILNATGVPISPLDTGTGNAAAVWIWQDVPSNIPADTGAVATLGIVGIV